MTSADDPPGPAVIAETAIKVRRKRRRRRRMPLRIVVLSTLAIFVIIAAAASIIAGFSFLESTPPKLARQTDYAGLRLGMSPIEVIYAKDTPHAVSQREEIVEFNSNDDIPKVDLQLKLEAGKAISDYRHWDYQMTHPTSGIVERLLDVNFNSDRTALVTIRCIAYDDFYGRCPSIAGVIDGSTEQDVIQRLGPPNSTEIKSGIKVLTYRTLGIGLRLRKERVYLLSITDANYRS